MLDRTFLVIWVEEDGRWMWEEYELTDDKMEQLLTKMVKRRQKDLQYFLTHLDVYVVNKGVTVSVADGKVTLR